jgi:hypothetical protein
VRALVVVLLLAAACAPRRIVSHGQVNEVAVDAVRVELPVVRQLAFTTRVPVEALSQEQITALVAEEIEASYRPGDLERTELVYGRLGLLPPGTKLRPAMQRLYEQEGAGFYDPRTKRLVLARSALGAGGFRVDLLGFITGRDLVGEFLVAHELTHALQDQHWGIPTVPEPITDAHGDRELARRGLLEGDATLAGFAYLGRGPLSPSAIALVERELHGVPGELARKYPDVPDLLRVSLAFAYDEGTTFTGTALAEGGWVAVDRVHADPPASTEQVLHPERYFTTRDRPVTITLGGTAALERQGWERVLEDTLGELQIRVLAARFLPPERAERVAEGWGGDRLRALQQGPDVLLVWMTAWDSPDDAVEFADAMPAIAPDARVERREDRVLVLIGPPAELDELPAAVWSKTALRRES